MVGAAYEQMDDDEQEFVVRATAVGIEEAAELYAEAVARRADRVRIGVCVGLSERRLNSEETVAFFYALGSLEYVQRTRAKNREPGRFQVEASDADGVVDVGDHVNPERPQLIARAIDATEGYALAAELSAAHVALEALDTIVLTTASQAEIRLIRSALAAWSRRQRLKHRRRLGGAADARRN